MAVTPPRKRHTIIVSAAALLLAAGVTTAALQLNAEAEGSHAAQPVTITPEAGSKASESIQGPGAAATAATPAPAEAGAATSERPADSAQPAAPVPAPAAPEGAVAGMSVVELAEIKQPVSAAALDEPIAIGPRVEAHLGQLEAVDGEAAGVGEVSGPAVRFVVTLTNRTGQDLPTNNTVVTANAGPDERPALQLSGPGATSLPAVIPAGQEISANFVFLIPPELRNQVRIFVNYEASSPIAAFAGTAPGAKSQ
ncbi:hypothetical protein [Arthrobacter sp. UYCu723]